MTLVVREVNTAPVLNPIASLTNNELTAFTFTAIATDSDLPANTLTFSLLNAPPGSGISGASGVFAWTPTESQGPSTNTFQVVVTDDGTSALSATQAVTLVVREANTVPTLNPIASLTNNELTLITFTATATDSDQPANVLTYSLLNAPPGSGINGSSGVFAWTPTEAQGPSTNTFQVVVTDNGTPALSATQAVTLVIREVNTAPILAPIGDRSVKEGTLLTFVATTSDPDLPSQRLSFSLDADAPAGAAIAANTGLFTWTPPVGYAPATKAITVRVTDDGTPPLDDFETIIVTVTAHMSPSIALSKPTANSTFLPSAPITLLAQASDPDGTVAKVEFLADGVRLGESTNVPYSLVWSNGSIGSHSLQALATDSDGLTGLSEAVAIEIRPGFITNVTLIATGSVWKYLDNGTDQGTAWRGLTFHDSTWASGPAQLGYDEGDEATLISDGGDPTNRYVTYYFRHAFVVPEPSSIMALRADLLRDDGAVVYLNSNEVFRSNMPEGSVNYLTLASNTVGSAAEYTFYPTNLDPSVLVANTNLLAVEVHQVLVTSTDVSFDFGLMATQSVFFPWIVDQPVEQRSPLGGDVTFAVLARGSRPLGYQWFFNGSPLASATSPTLNLNSVQRTNAGSYSVVISNLAGSVTSSPAALVLTAPTLDPVGDKIVTEGALLSFTVTATDPDLPGQTLTFSLESGAPAGATIQPLPGLFTWTPAEDQGPGSYTIAVRVMDNGTPPQGDLRTFNIVVSEANTAPVLNPIASLTNNELTAFTFTATATDSDLPANTLTFSLLNAPPGSGINESSGVFSWTPTESQGPSTNTFQVVVTDDGTPALSATQAVTLVVREVNTAPVLNPIASLTNNELTAFTFTATASDSDLPANTLTFSLLNAPPGSDINGSSGVFSWTPTESQGPSTNTFQVVVTDDGTPALSATQAVTLVVRKVNTAPALGPLTNRTIYAGELLTFTASATDSDVPANALTFSLVNPPPGATINASSGAFSWTPSEAQASTTNTIKITVADNGQPPLSDTNTFSVLVVNVLKITEVSQSDDSVTFSWNSMAGRTYRVFYKNSLAETFWQQLGQDVPATGTTTSKTDPFGVGSGRFYRVVLVE